MVVCSGVHFKVCCTFQVHIYWYRYITAWSTAPPLLVILQLTSDQFNELHHFITINTGIRKYKNMHFNLCSRVKIDLSTKLVVEVVN